MAYYKSYIERMSSSEYCRKLRGSKDYRMYIGAIIESV